MRSERAWIQSKLKFGSKLSDPIIWSPTKLSLFLWSMDQNIRRRESLGWIPSRECICVNLVQSSTEFHRKTLHKKNSKSSLLKLFESVTTVPSIHPSIGWEPKVVQALVLELNQRSPWIYGCSHYWPTSLYMVVPTIDSHHHIWLFPPLIHIIPIVSTIDPHLIVVVPNIHPSTSLQSLFPPLIHITMVVPTIDSHHYGHCSHHWFASLWLFPPLIHIATVVPTIDSHHYGHCSHYWFASLQLFPPLIHITTVVPTIDSHHYSCCSHHWSTSLRLFPPLIHIITVVVPTIDPHHYCCSHHQFFFGPLFWCDTHRVSWELYK